MVALDAYRPCHNTQSWLGWGTITRISSHLWNMSYLTPLIGLEDFLVDGELSQGLEQVAKTTLCSIQQPCSYVSEPGAPPDIQGEVPMQEVRGQEWNTKVCWHEGFEKV